MTFLKWVARNPWVWALADQTKKRIVDPLYKKYVKPILSKKEDGKERGSE